MKIPFFISNLKTMFIKNITETKKYLTQKNNLKPRWDLVIAKKVDFLISEDSYIEKVENLSELYKKLDIQIEKNIVFNLAIEELEKREIESIPISIELEKQFLSKVVFHLENILKQDKKNVLLFDLDETICYRDDDYENKTSEDFFRPSFFILLEYLKEKYSDNIDFWILSSRWIIKEDLNNDKWMWKIAHLINKDYIFSSREYEFDLYSENEIYTPDSVHITSWYYQKVNAFVDIKTEDPNNNFILIDDIIKWWKFEEFKEWICVRDYVFIWKIIWI